MEAISANGRPDAIEYPSAMTTAVVVRRAFEDPARLRALIESAGPFWPIVNYAGSDAEMKAIGSQAGMIIPPWFRQDFALGGTELVPGADWVLHNPSFIDAARAVYGAEAIVRPTTVYINVMGPTPFGLPPHLDVPAYRGFTRADYPVWLLKTMGTSGMFEHWRIKLATAVSWLYDGPGGDFHYWPDGPEGAAETISPPFDNVAVVADNEATYHGVSALGPAGTTMLGGLTRDSSLTRIDGGWQVSTDDAVNATFDDVEVRYTVSWKADCFPTAADADRADANEDLLTLEHVVEAFLDDLSQRGVNADRPEDPLFSREWVELLAAHYRDPAPRIR